jgi:HEPN domain-containing protein
MDIPDIVLYWKQSAQKDLPAMESLFSAGHYPWALYIGHLVLEKALKARWVFDNGTAVPPKTHSLDRLAKETKLTFDEETLAWFVQVSDFNIEARYPDYRLEFHRRATAEFTEKNLKKIREQTQCILRTM